VRVQGGAYGGFCVFDHRSGVWSFLSYRDPNLLATLEVYDGTSTFLRDLDLSASELTRGIIGAIGSMDAYQLPDAKGYTSLQRYLVGDTDELRQRRREEILATTAADFHSFTEVLDESNAQGAVVVLGSQAAIDAANAERPGMFEVTPVM
jgi:Zn-dependent M16 (insulinase) family peptidase